MFFFCAVLFLAVVHFLSFLSSDSIYRNWLDLSFTRENRQNTVLIPFKK